MIRVAFLILLSAPTIVAAQASLGAGEIRQINALFAEFDRDGSPGYALGVVIDDALILSRGYGRADLDNNVPITPRTSFHWASLSKQFTAAPVALLILDGKLSFDTSVAKYFPALAPYGADIAIRHLIYFTSGLP